MAKITSILLVLTSVTCLAQPVRPYWENQTPTYDEVIAAYEALEEKYENAVLVPVGSTDSGRPLHVFVIGGAPMSKRNPPNLKGKAVVLINNGIHPGESCGIDASLVFVEEMLAKGISDNVVFAIVPVYNVGGSLNRGSHSRANQLGPEEHGFRGNAGNLDLNRDFIKADALNTLEFYKIFHAFRPHIFVDTHTSNGADYQYTMTLISTQKDKLNPVLSELMQEEIEPFLYKGMAKAGWEMIPYVNVFGYTPDKGFSAFLETPRYASGYTSLFNSIGFITETHMLKPYRDRVESTLSFLKLIADYTQGHQVELIEARKEAMAYDRRQSHFALNWALDSSATKILDFKGYEYEYVPSKLGDYQRLRYLDEKKKTYKVDYWDSYKVTDSASVPKYYVVPSAWREVVQLLEANQVEMQPLARDSSMEVSNYYVTSSEFARRPYEGHFPLTEVKVKKSSAERQFLKGDLLISTDQKNIRFIMAVLEPTAVDSYLRWNFFDAIFQRKEYFSPYVFEDTAEQLLEEHPEWRKAFESWKEENPQYAKNPYASLQFIYQLSPYYEKEHLRYPVARIE